MANTARVNQQRPMNCQFDDILTFISVVEAGSVTSAAARLNVSKSVISKRISDLEAALRVELIQRSTGNVKPTEVARSCYERIVPLIRGITEVTERISQRNDLTGRLRVTAPISFGTNFLGPVIAEFARRYPELEIAVDYEDRFVNLRRMRAIQNGISSRVFLYVVPTDEELMIARHGVALLSRRGAQQRVTAA